MKWTFITTVIFLVLSILSGCASLNNYDSIEIVDIKQHSLHGQEAVYAVTVNYNFVSKEAGKVAVGFNINAPNSSKSYRMSAHEEVTKGAGTLVLKASVSLPDNRKSIEIMSNLSEFPHPKRWQPIVRDVKVIHL